MCISACVRLKAGWSSDFSCTQDVVDVLQESFFHDLGVIEQKHHLLLVFADSSRKKEELQIIVELLTEISARGLHLERLIQSGAKVGENTHSADLADPS